MVAGGVYLTSVCIRSAWMARKYRHYDTDVWCARGQRIYISTDNNPDFNIVEQPYHAGGPCPECGEPIACIAYWEYVYIDRQFGDGKWYTTQIARIVRTDSGVVEVPIYECSACEWCDVGNAPKMTAELADIVERAKTPHVREPLDYVAGEPCPDCGAYIDPEKDVAHSDCFWVDVQGADGKWYEVDVEHFADTDSGAVETYWLECPECEWCSDGETPKMNKVLQEVLRKEAMPHPAAKISDVWPI